MKTSKATMISIKAGYRFKSLDTKGDFVGETMYAEKIKGSMVYVVFDDGGQDWYDLSELNIDPSSVISVIDIQ